MSAEGVLSTTLLSHLHVQIDNNEKVKLASHPKGKNTILLSYCNSMTTLAFTAAWTPGQVIFHARIDAALSQKITITFDSTLLAFFLLLHGKMPSPFSSTASKKKAYLRQNGNHQRCEDVWLHPLQYAVVSLPKQIYRLQFDPGDHFEFTAICLHRSVLNQWPDESLFSAFRKKVMLNEAVELDNDEFIITSSMLPFALDLSDPDLNYPKLMWLHIRTRQLIFEIMQEILNNTASAGNPVQKSTLALVQNARCFMLNNLPTLTSRAVLLKYLGVGPRRMVRAFREIYKKTLFEVFNDDRMGYAWRWTKQGQLSMETISAALGYKNREYFSQAFKDYWGISPSKNRINPLLNKEQRGS